MKKNNFFVWEWSIPKLQKLLRVMKLTTFLFLISVISVFADKTYSQTKLLKLDVKSSTVKEVLQNIEEQSEFYFMYSEKLVDVNRQVSVNIENQKINVVLDNIFAGTNVIYTVKDRFILLTTPEVLGDEITVQQQKTVSGTVTDDSGQTLPGVAVVVKGTTQGTVTNVDGEYSISIIPENAVLQFSFMGMRAQEITVGNQTRIDITMVVDAIGLDEVVAIGYGTSRKKDLTGAVGSIDVTSRIEDEAPSNLQDILRGNIAGVETGFDISAKGGGDLQIRGQNSLKTSSSPLIVIDGVIYYGAMSDINTFDIKSIDVLKDASSAAVFGSKASNGVIMITTKKGTTEKPIINFDASIGLATTATMVPLYDPEGFLSWRQDVMKSMNYYNSSTKDKLYKFENPNELPTGVTLDMWKDGNEGDPTDIWLTRIGILPIEKNNYKAGKSVNWEDMVYQHGLRQDYNLSMSGKKSEVTYYWSIGYANNEGIIVGDKFKTIQSRLNLESKVAEWIIVGLNTQFANRDESGITADWQGIQRNSPWGSVYEEDGITLRYRPTDDIGDARIPIYDLEFRDRFQTYNTFISNLYTELKLPFGITYRLNFAPRFEWRKYLDHQSALHQEWGKFGGQATRTQNEIYSWQVDNLIKWNKTINDIHKIDFTFLANAEKYQSWDNTMSIQGFSPTDALGYHNVSAGTVSSARISSNDQYETANALMGRLFYSLRDKYLLTLSIRRDGYSAFGLSHPYGTFPSAALGWVFSEEDFWKNEFITYGKLRFSWGKNGNRSIGRYSALPSMAMRMYAHQPLQGSVYESSTLYLTRMANADLKWEGTSSLNLGFDFAIKDELLSGSIELYQARTLDLLVDRALPDILGIKTVAANLGEVENKGFEFTLNARIMDKANFKWRSNINFSLNRNKIISLYGDMEDILDDTGIVIGQKESDDITNKWFIGHAIDEIWDPVVKGVYQIGEEAEAAKLGKFPGDFKLKDVDNSGNINYADHEFQGFREPRFRWNMRHEFNVFQNFDFSFNMYSYWGHYDTFNSAKNRDGRYPDRNNSYITPYWTPENPSNTWARIGSSEGGAVFSVYREKSFIRLDNVTLSYSFPNSLLKEMKISNLKLYGTVRNVAWWAPQWKLTDPEKEKSSNWQVQDPDHYGPSPRYFTLGINVTLQ